MEHEKKEEVPTLQRHHNVIEPRSSSFMEDHVNSYTCITKVGQLVIKQTRLSGQGNKLVISEAVNP